MLWYDTFLRLAVILKMGACCELTASMNLWSQFEISAEWANCPPGVRELLLAAREGRELTFDQGLHLATSSAAGLDALVAAADLLRRETVGDAITYVVNRNLNFTNVCFVGCSFCGFARGAGAPDAYFHSAEHLVNKARKPGTAAQPKSASRAACRAISTVFSIATSCAPSSMRFQRFTFTHFLRWKFPTASTKPGCRSATIFR